MPSLPFDRFRFIDGSGDEETKVIVRAKTAANPNVGSYSTVVIPISSNSYIDIQLVSSAAQADVTSLVLTIQSKQVGAAALSDTFTNWTIAPTDASYALDSVTIVWTAFDDAGNRTYSADVRCSTSKINPTGTGHKSKNTHAVETRVPVFADGTTVTLRESHSGGGHSSLTARKVTGKPAKRSRRLG